MTTVTTLPHGRPLTRADLELMPDDGHKYELLDGVLVVSPAPRTRHQEVVGGLYVLLRENRPADLKVLFSPVDVVLAEDTVLQPDLLVAPREQFTDRDLPGAPLLAVEVLSPSTRRFDLLLKRDRFQSAGVRSYWLVDPDVPSVTVLELQDRVYAEVAHVEGAESCDVLLPYPMTIVPEQLLD